MKPNPHIDEEGNEYWINDDGLYHREGAPARVRKNGNNSWWLNGKLHRIGGPAIDYTVGVKSWYLWGEQYDKEEYKRIVRILKIKNLTNEQN